ncbi:hypothetical protein DUNSADRAFT_13507 [Dunaliella salina]|uniref:Encoded protein n=1 Tax=Dunaliella salina TaxID=3046 RepID=A0ABQ7G957_DUNSA|nr:hypothetical protein DUNSADRAFT_13507 [Dunaliella salina]|eukprot:KAF5831150.1 hypothetical protein DUNSADRAFT_13507 [Dunaliella salina]
MLIFLRSRHRRECTSHGRLTVLWCLKTALPHSGPAGGPQRLCLRRAEGCTGRLLLHGILTILTIRGKADCQREKICNKGTFLNFRIFYILEKSNRNHE